MYEFQNTLPGYLAFKQILTPTFICDVWNQLQTEVNTFDVVIYWPCYNYAYSVIPDPTTNSLQKPKTSNCDLIRDIFEALIPKWPIYL